MFDQKRFASVAKSVAEANTSQITNFGMDDIAWLVLELQRARNCLDAIMKAGELMGDGLGSAKSRDSAILGTAHALMEYELGR